jgi:hypothetical protein
LVFTPTEIHALAGAKKIEILKQLVDACKDLNISLKLHTKPKKENGKEQIEAVLNVLKASAETPVIGTLAKVFIDFCTKFSFCYLIISAISESDRLYFSELVLKCVVTGKAHWRFR